MQSGSKQVHGPASVERVEEDRQAVAGGRAAEASLAMPSRGVRALPARPSKTLRPATKSGGPEGKLRGRPPPPHCRAPDLGDGRGLNPSPDEREPADQEYY